MKDIQNRSLVTERFVVSSGLWVSTTFEHEDLIMSIRIDWNVDELNGRNELRRTLLDQLGRDEMLLMEVGRGFSSSQ